MANITNLKFKSQYNPESITYHSNDSRVTTYYTGWVGNVDTRYRFTKANVAGIAGNDVDVDFYIDQTYDSEKTFLYQDTDGSGTWHGRCITNGLELHLYIPQLTVINVDEEFTLSRPVVTLYENDLDMANGDKIHKVIFIDSSGSHVVFHEQLETPSYVSSVVTHNSITWTFKNEDVDLAVDVWARIGSNSFVEMQSNVAAGANFDLEFTGLSESTGYNVDVYVTPTSGTAKQNSEQATNTQTTTAAPVKVWVYQGTTGTYYRTTNYYGNNAVCKFAVTPAVGVTKIEAAYPAANEPLGRKGRTVNYNNEFPSVLCSYYYYEVEYQ